MTNGQNTWTEASVAVAGLTIPVRRAGSGPTVVILHDDIGTSGLDALLDALAARFSVVVPALPGWVPSARPEFVRSVHDVAVLTQQTIDRLGLTGADAVGLGFGGWIAAEIASMSANAFARLALVAPTGLLPLEGEYLDQFLVSGAEYVRAGFADPGTYAELFGEQPTIDQLEEWEINREMTTRVTWSPYMYNRSLAHFLKSVDLPVLVAWGSKDRVVPRDVVQQYVELLPHAQLSILDGAGHWAAIERPDAVAALISDFFAAKQAATAGVGA